MSIAIVIGASFLVSLVTTLVVVAMAMNRRNLHYEDYKARKHQENER